VHECTQQLHIAKNDKAQHAIALLRVGFLSTIYLLLRAEFDTRPKTGLSESTFAIMRMDPNIKLASAASYSAYYFTLQESKTFVYHG